MQCCVIRRIVEDLNIPTNVVIMPTVRESDGLAMSSRNAYLTLEERLIAPVVFKSLLAGEQAWLDNDKQASADEIVAEVQKGEKSRRTTDRTFLAATFSSSPRLTSRNTPSFATLFARRSPQPGTHGERGTVRERGFQHQHAPHRLRRPRGMLFITRSQVRRS